MCIIIGMSWASVSSTLLPPVGVVIGASGTLLGQHLALRVDARCEAAQRAADQRAERKDAIICFLSTTEWVEQRRDERPGKPDRGYSALVELMHAGWLTKKIIELVCSGELARRRWTTPWNLTGPARNSARVALGSDRQACPPASGDSVRSSWKQPAMKRATQANHCCDACMPRQTSLKAALRRSSKLEILGHLDVRHRM